MADYQQGRLERLGVIAGSVPPWAALSKAEGVRDIDLGECRVTDADLHALTGIKSRACLILSGTDVTDDCIPILEKMPSLRSMNVRATRITPEGVKRLKQHFGANNVSASDPPQSRRGSPR